MRGFNIYETEKEDIRQEFALSRLEGSRQPYRYFVIDHLRKLSGRKGARSYSARQNLHLFARELSSASDIYFDPRETLGNRIALERAFRVTNLKKRDEEILNMFLEGYYEAEIGNRYKISESRISQILQRISRSLSEGIKKEARCARKRAREMAGMGEIKVFILSFPKNTRLAFGESWAMASLNETRFEEWLT